MFSVLDEVIGMINFTGTAKKNICIMCVSVILDDSEFKKLNFILTKTNLDLNSFSLTKLAGKHTVVFQRW